MQVTMETTSRCSLSNSVPPFLPSNQTWSVPANPIRFRSRCHQTSIPLQPTSHLPSDTINHPTNIPNIYANLFSSCHLSPSITFLLTSKQRVLLCGNWSICREMPNPRMGRKESQTLEVVKTMLSLPHHQR